MKPTPTLGSDSSQIKVRSAKAWLLLPLFVLGVMSSIGCQPDKKPSDGARGVNGESSNTIVTTSYPIQWVTKQIVGDQYRVSFPANSFQQPDHWRPDRETISEIQSADMIICNGIAAPYASWMQTVSLPSSKVIDSASKGLSLADFISVKDVTIVHTHGPEGEHSHPTMVSRTWLDPAMLIKQANYITEQLSKRFPDNAALYREHLATITSKLKSINTEPLPEQTELVFSATPELKFFTRAAGVSDVHFNWNEKTTLKEAETDLASKNEAKSVRFILFPQRLEGLASQLKPALQQRNLTPVFIDMLDRENPDRDFITRLGDNFKRLQTSLSASP